MDDVSLTWPQLTAIATGVAAVVGALGRFGWKIMDGQVKEWKKLHEAKAKELDVKAKELTAARKEIDTLRKQLSQRSASGQITNLNELPGGFTKLVAEYQSANLEPEEKRRIKLKDSLAFKLGGFAIGREIPRHVLVEWREPGSIVALAQIIANQPKEGDGQLLVTVSRTHVPPHARHQVIDAIEKLAKEGKLDDTDRAELLNVLDQFDAELKNDNAARRIEKVRQELRQAA